jgi:uncharacterized pyridoxal phosphate-containing UPF0001 family protein
MSLGSQRIKQVQANLKHVQANVQNISPKVRVVAVSKTKPASDIQAAYDIGQRHFGESVIPY